MDTYEAFRDKAKDILDKRFEAINNQALIQSKIDLLSRKVGDYVAKHNRDTLLGDGRNMGSIAPKTRQELSKLREQLQQEQDIEDELWAEYQKLRSGNDYFAFLFDKEWN